MALGGGTFVTQNKILPGAYINFVSAANASTTLSDRGIAAVPFVGDWGADEVVMEVSADDFQKNSLQLFGYDFTHDKMKGFRDLFKNARYAFIYKLNSGGAKATNTHATAVCNGARGNDLKVVIQTNADEPTKFDVSLFLETTLVDKQIVTTAADLKANSFVTWKGAALAVTAGLPLSGGTSTTVTNGDYQTFLDLVESYSFNAICCPSDASTIKGLFTAFTKRMRDEQGVKFQCVTHKNSADYEGVVNVKNDVVEDDANVYDAVYWVTGVIAGTPVNKSALNKIYDGEYILDVNFTQTQLEFAIKNGEFTFHRVGSDIRVLSDINSLVNVTLEKGDLFKENQTVRVIDQIANDIAVLFNTKYLGVVPNDEAGRISLWADIVKHHEQLQDIRAIENFNDSDISVSQGNTKKSVVVADFVTVVNAMAQLYMTVTVA